MKKILSILLFTLLIGCMENNVKSNSSNQLKNLTITIGSNQERISMKQSNKVSLSTPESIVTYNRAIYIANIGGNPLASPKKGFITKIKNTGATNLFTGLLDDPKGFAFINNDLIIVSDHPNIKLLKISTGEVVDSLAIDSPGFLNDLLLLDKSNAFVSDTGKGLIYKVSISPTYNKLSYTVLEGINENGVNGLAINNNTDTLYFVTSTFGGDATRGHIFEAKLNKDYSLQSSATKWNTPQIGAGALDGLVFVKGQLILSDWGIDNGENAAKIYIYKVSDRSLKATISGEITSAADITFSNNTLFIPEFLKNRFTVVNIAKYLK